MEFPSKEFEDFARDFVRKKLTTRLVVPLSEIASPFRLHLPKFGAMMDNERLDKLLAAAVMIEGGMELKVAAKPAATRPKDRLFATRIFHEAPLQGVSHSWATVCEGRCFILTRDRGKYVKDN